MEQTALPSPAHAPGPLPSVARLAPWARVLACVCRQRSCILRPLERGLAGYACRACRGRSLISSRLGIVVGPSRLNKPIGWPRKAGSNSSAPCSLFSTLALCVARSLPASTLQAFHLDPTAQQAGRRRRRKRYYAAVLETTARSPGGSSALSHNLPGAATRLARRIW